MSLILDGTNGVSDIDGSASTPAIRGTDTNTGIFFGTDIIGFSEGGAEAMRIDSSGNVRVGTTSALSGYRLATVGGSTFISDANKTVTGGGNIQMYTSDSQAADIGPSIGFGGYYIGTSSDTEWAQIAGRKENGTSNNFSGYLQFSTRANGGSNAERARITSAGDLLVGATSFGSGSKGFGVNQDGVGYFVKSGGYALIVGRLTNDGDLVIFEQAGVNEGSISVSGSTISYNGGHLSRWAQMPGTKDDTLVKGTVMSNLDEMNVYIAPTTYWTEEDELPEGVNVGDVKVETHEVDNEQLNKVKVSDVEGDVNVAGVFVNWTYDEAHQVDEINMAMTGDMIIRIAQGVVVQKGDLLMSAGDGTAKPQGDDIVRSKTVAKVTSNHVTCTYADGSYCVPCVLMAC